MRSTLAFLSLIALLAAWCSVAAASPASRPKQRLVTLTRTATMTKVVTVTPTRTVTKTSTALSGCTAAPTNINIKARSMEERDEKPAKLYHAVGTPVKAQDNNHEAAELDTRSDKTKRFIVWRIVNRTVVQTSTAAARTATSTVTKTVCTGKAVPTSVSTVAPVTIKPATSTSTPATSTATSITAAQSATLVPQQLGYHNDKRALHFNSTVSTPPLALNDTLGQYAITYGKLCNPGHSGGPYGENLAWGAPPNAWTDEELFDLWYAEGNGYDYSDNYFAEATGHFTQVIWKGSSQLGCATVVCPGSDAMFGKTVPYKSLTCEYSQTRGNWQGYFVQNVIPPAVAGT